MSLLQVENLRRTFHGRKTPVHAVNDVSFEIEEGETLALIGESGSGKSTVGRLVLRLLEADSGRVVFDGTDVRSLDAKRMRAMRADLQIVFQEPYESLNPKLSVGDIVAEPLHIHERGLSRSDRRDRVLRTLAEVGLGPDHADRRPGALSGGQQQRVGIARALVTRPRLLVLDEPTSSLDLSVQAQVLEILSDLQSKHGLAYLYISHDLATVAYIAHRIAVMYLGQIRETGPVDQVIDAPQDPYTRALLGAHLSPRPGQVRAAVTPVRGEIPTASNLPVGCFFHARCPVRMDECTQAPIPLAPVSREPAHGARCLRVDDATSDVADRATAVPRA